MIILEKRCHKCGDTKDASFFNKDKSSKDGLQSQCKDCQKEYRNLIENKAREKLRLKKQYENNRESILSHQKQRFLDDPNLSRKRWERDKKNNPDRPRRKWKEMRLKFLSMYGGKCSLCGTREYEFLSLDHVNEDGAESRRKHKDTSWAYKDAVKTGLPDFSRYQILCHNHNFSKSRRRIKPYEELSWGGKFRRDLRDAVLKGYGGKCSCCGESTKEFLQLDHVLGGGTKHILQVGSREVYKDALSREFPPDYQLLCCNCNRSKHWGNGICIHQREEKESNAE